MLSIWSFRVFIGYGNMLMINSNMLLAIFVVVNIYIEVDQSSSWYIPLFDCFEPGNCYRDRDYVEDRMFEWVNIRDYDNNPDDM